MEEGETRLLPGLERVTPAVASWVVTDPSSSTAVEVEVVRCSVNKSVSALGNHLGVLGRDPDTSSILGVQDRVSALLKWTYSAMVSGAKVTSCVMTIS
jgi:hypothetical protein